MSPRTVAVVAAVAVILILLSARDVGAAYTQAVATTALGLAKASYCDGAAIENWSCASCAAHPGIGKVQVMSNALLGTQAFMGVSTSHIVVSFRGSQNIPNWIRDLDFYHTPYTKPNCTGCKVHDGFLISFASLQDRMWQYLQDLVGAHPRLPVLITGHSLGGAMANLAAAEFASRPYASGAVPRIELYTFGAPRVGNAAFSDWLLALFCSGGHEMYRITHSRDPVPHLPPMYMGFEHGPHEVWYDNAGSTSYRNCSDEGGTECPAKSTAEDPACSNSILPIHLPDHLLYLGECTSCVCVSDDTPSDALLRLSPELEWVIAMDYVYQQERIKRRLSPLYATFS
ncbi:lipase [Trypanosoma rangeli SC58]|nr:lipase [Trypanosoma rangeli SC58]